ncbi:MAG: NAD(P)(+) transhydrogenase (Re/Si-specific) subunit beta [Pseudomonadota bacterium]|nr:NAD(P)(+) transhydrogenase (Re/Si-specific) subunit beta [Pseudomonadota bacterium]MEC7095794.1 NAD(P)(+) transhydrogenase (Re/Si-specific) subunit beta [Pseudomonadota bacterium]MEC7492271.1 NAD(P)(+) transhydrogenase (Re/Si-specific) subunit beta [Pseudomonadota bacterium]MEC7518191.1 NAD(P)(+) transhydrogenase (Re/Si-specific) subunit beta [Pseudomonadota bacterium]MEC7959448.1 NAD(P)(+) transhydrogenase (Re/Si-specific) subunit beta [Pseudomonadota bacterium]
MDLGLIIQLGYVVAAGLFIFGLKMLGSPDTARRGNGISAIGMLVAIIAALLDQGIVQYEYILGGMVVGGLIGAVAARTVAMTSMPEMVALFNGVGGAASGLVGVAALSIADGSFTYITIILSILIGGVTFTGSLVAYGKLSETIGSGAVTFGGQKFVNGLIVIGILASAVMFVMDPTNTNMLYTVVGLSLLFGIMVVIPIGGADMPVVISLLNSYSGLAACAAGFAVDNNVLIVAGSLVGASGIILTQIMCKAMNRSLSNVLFSGFASVSTTVTEVEGEIKPISVEDAYYVLEAATNVAIIPGYGMAVAQAQHVVKELMELLEANGCEVNYGIHPVAGRMPGHMNVLLAEADVPYDQLLEMDDINPRMESVDVAIVIGANDVVNPAAREVESSPIYGMPVINVADARTVFVLKRSMASGFAGIENPLFYKDNTRMLFGDAKESIGGLVREFS